MGTEWDLSRYQIESAAQALEAVWSAIQSRGQGRSKRSGIQDVTRVLREVHGCFNGAGHLLLMLKSERSAKDQISKIADLCKKVEERENFANEHKIALTGVVEFLENMADAPEFPSEVRAMTQGASKVALQRFSRIDSAKGSSSKLASVRFKHEIDAIHQKVALLPNCEKNAFYHILHVGERKIKEAASVEEASDVYSGVIRSIIERLQSTPDLSEPGKMFLRWMMKRSFE